MNKPLPTAPEMQLRNYSGSTASNQATPYARNESTAFDTVDSHQTALSTLSSPSLSRPSRGGESYLIGLDNGSKVEAQPHPNSRESSKPRAAPLNFSLPQPNVSRIAGRKKIIQYRTATRSRNPSYHDPQTSAEAIPRVSLSSDPGVILQDRERRRFHDTLQADFRIKRLSTCPPSLNVGPTLKISEEAQRFIMGCNEQEADIEVAEKGPEFGSSLRAISTELEYSLDTKVPEEYHAGQGYFHSIAERTPNSLTKAVGEAIEAKEQEYVRDITSIQSDQKQKMISQATCPVQPLRRPNHRLRDLSVQSKNKIIPSKSKGAETFAIHNPAFDFSSHSGGEPFMSADAMEMKSNALSENTSLAQCEAHPGRRLPTPDLFLAHSEVQTNAKNINCADLPYQRSQSKSRLIMNNIRGLFQKRPIDQMSDSFTSLEKQNSQISEASGQDFQIDCARTTHGIAKAWTTGQNAVNLHPDSQIKPQRLDLSQRLYDKSEATVDISSSIPVVISLMEAAKNAPPGPEKNRLMSLSQAMVEAITSARNAEKAMCKAQQAAHEAEICYDLTMMSVGEALEILHRTKFIS